MRHLPPTLLQQLDRYPVTLFSRACLPLLLHEEMVFLEEGMPFVQVQPLKLLTLMIPIFVLYKTNGIKSRPLLLRNSNLKELLPQPETLLPSLLLRQRRTLLPPQQKLLPIHSLPHLHQRHLRLHHSHVLHHCQ